MAAREQTKTKSVTFADDQNTSHIYDALATDILWEWPEFFEESRKEAKREGRKLQKQGLGELLEGCFCSARTDVQKCLNAYAKLADGRGIERFAYREMYDERKEERTKAIQAILIGQKQARDKGLPSDVTAQELREVALVYCLNAKVFARRLGKADEAACYPKKKGLSSSASCCSMSSSQSTCTTASTQSTFSSQRARVYL